MSVFEEVKSKKKHKFPRDLHFHVGPVESLHRLDRVWKAYQKYRGYDDHLDFRETCKIDPENKRIVRVYHRGKIIAFSILRIYPIPVSLQFAWDYEKPKLRLGIKSLENECAWAKNNGYKYLYLGQDDRYKSQFKGYEVLEPL